MSHFLFFFHFHSFVLNCKQHQILIQRINVQQFFMRLSFFYTFLLNLQIFNTVAKFARGRNSIYRTIENPMKQNLLNLQLNVEGFRYKTMIDTGSNAFWIKGDNSFGFPRRKYICKECVRQNKKVLFIYKRNEIAAYTQSIKIKMNDQVFNANVFVAFNLLNPKFNEIESVLGLSFVDMEQKIYPFFLRDLYNANLIENYTFALTMDLLNTEKSVVTFGKYQQSVMKVGSKIKYYNMLKYMQYKILTKGIKIRNDFVMIGQAIIDSGKSHISLPYVLSDEILKAFNTRGNNCWINSKINIANPNGIIQCRVHNPKNLPDFKILIQEQEYVLTKQYYLQTCKQEGFGFDCKTLIRFELEGSNIELGAAFLQRYYVIFDLENKKIGIVQNRASRTFNQVIRNDFL